MKQMITRLPDELHSDLRNAAASRGESMNEMVVGVLREHLETVGSSASQRMQTRRRLDRLDLLATPPRPPAAPTLAELDLELTGIGPVVGDELERQRDAR